MMKKMLKFAKDHPVYASTMHAIGGVGLGFLLTGYFGIGNITWGWILVALAVLLHFYAWMK